jgi:two-component system sensor histidine kinase PrrB
VLDARRRNPHHRIDLDVADASAVIDGWTEGLRLLVDNLIANSLLHGRSSDGIARVRVGIESSHGRLSLVVEDGGSGIPPHERENVKGRFVRGAGTTAPGSGLGLAMVDQQATLHGAAFSIGDRPGGGARMVVEFPPIS